MDKIGILTFHRAKNNGAKLQAYALQEILSGVSEVSIVDYRCDTIERVYYKNKLTFKKLVRIICKWVLLFIPSYKQSRDSKIRNKRFKEFDEKYLKTSSKIYRANDIATANSDYDKFIVGSDQVWNLSITNNDWNYLLEFADNDKKYSYAASFGKDSISIDNHDRFIYNLQSFKSILVREETGVRIIESLLGNKPKMVCDPVFLLSKEEWINKLSLKETKNKKPYLLFIEVAVAKYSIDFASKLASKRGLEPIYFNFTGKIKVPKGFKNIASVGPIGFLNYILNADVVVTTSFHALAFSALFNVPFFYELNHNKVNNNARIKDLAALFHIENKEIHSPNLNENYDSITNWNMINGIIKEYSCSSKEILFKSLDIEQ